VRTVVWAAIAALAVAAPAAARADEDAGAVSGRVSVEVVADRSASFVQEPVHLTFRAVLDAAWFDAHAVEMFRRPLDVPLQFEAAWLTEPPGTLLGDWAARTQPGAQRSVALGDDVAGAAVTESTRDDGTRVRVVEVHRVLVPDAPGEIVLTPTRLRFAWATQFDDDLVQGRVAKDRRDASLESAGLRIRVSAIPEEGRPKAWTGAVGRFTVRAIAGPTDLDVGESLRVVWTAEGDGNLGRFDPPRLDGFRGFHVFGALDDRGWGKRTVTYDVVVTDASVGELPPIELTVFDPGPPGAYRTLRTEPLPLRVRSEDGTPALAPGPVAGPPSTDGGPPASGNEGDRTALVVVLASAVVAAAGVLAALRRRAGRRPPEDAADARVTAALDRFHREAATDLPGAFAEVVAAVLGCDAAAVVGPGLRDRLAAAGADAELVERAAVLVEELVASRYGGAAPAEARSRASGTVADLAALHARGKGSGGA